VTLVGDATGRRLRLGDPVEARVVRVEPLRGRIELEPAGGPPRGPAVPPGGARRRRARAAARPR
jgi:ribonuclease R